MDRIVFLYIAAAWLLLLLQINCVPVRKEVVAKGSWSINLNDSTPLNISEASEKFALKFTSVVLRAAEPYSVAISCASVYSLFLLLSRGVTGNTAAAFRQIFYLPPLDSVDPLDVYNNLQKVFDADTRLGKFYKAQVVFTDSNRPLLPTYLTSLLSVYDADHIEIDMKEPKAFNKMNQHLSDSTRGKIQNTIDAHQLQISPYFLVSANYFEPEWQIPFLTNMTKMEPFFLNSSLYIPLPMMNQNGSYLYANLTNLKFESLMLNFKDHYKMLILLPHSNAHIFQVTQFVDSFGLHSIIGNMRKKILAVSVPRFFIQSKSSIKSILAQSDFLVDKNFPTNETLAKPDVVQAIAVNMVENEHIDENNETPASPESVEGELKVNRSFVFFIMDKASNEVIFAGCLRQSTEILVDEEN